MKKVLLIVLGILMLAIPTMAQLTTQTKVLTWTSKGDDGNVGTASAYDLRYSTDSSALVAWAVLPPASVIKATGLPIPMVAGTTQTFTIAGLFEGSTYFFAIKSVDEMGNWSGISNILKVTILDTTPPAAITDLR